MNKKLVLFCILIFGLAHSANATEMIKSVTKWQNMITSTSRVITTYDIDNHKLRSFEQELDIQSDKIFMVPILGYTHESSYGLNVVMDANFSVGGNETLNSVQFATLQSGEGRFYDVNVKYIYTGTYDWKGNYYHLFELGTNKSWVLTQDVFAKAVVGYSHEQYNYIMGSQMVSVNDRDIFYKLEVFHETGKYIIGADYKVAYSIGTFFNNLVFKNETVSIYSGYKF